MLHYALMFLIVGLIAGALARCGTGVPAARSHTIAPVEASTA